MTTFQKIVKYFAIALAFAIIAGVLVGVLRGASFLSKISDATTDDGVVEDIDSSADIRKLRVNLFRTNLKIVEGDRFSAETDNKDVTIKERMGTLVIEENSRSVIDSVPETEVVLTVPKGYSFRKIDVSTGAGNFFAEFVKAENIDFDFGAGKVSVDALYATDKIEIDGGAGKIEIRDGETNNLDLDIGVGKLHYRAHITGDSEIDCGVGGVELVLTGGEENYTVSLDKGIGNASINDEIIADGVTHGNGENKIDIDGGIGDIEVIFE
ncbi:MAG: DUF4097 domain-containing protein [Ruminococcaceae bacterium]|nr:DUF4097 domain-containing protein [Oscillospiraceae bacterium]